MENKTLLWVAMTMGLALTGIARAGSATNSGPATLHYVAQTTLTNKHSLTNGPVGTLKLDYYDKSSSLLQKFDITVTNLSSLQLYSLLAAFGDDPTLYEVETFTTDKKGKARISAQQVSFPDGSVNPTLKPLPPLLNPLLGVRQISITRDQTNRIAQASIDNAALFAFQVKRNLTRVDPAATAAGSIDLKATTLGATLKLKADGLVPFSMYFLAINSNIVNTTLSDKGGRLQMIGWPAGVLVGPSLHQLDVLDGNSNAVLTTTLPQ